MLIGVRDMLIGVRGILLMGGISADRSEGYMAGRSEGYMLLGVNHQNPYSLELFGE